MFHTSMEHSLYSQHAVIPWKSQQPNIQTGLHMQPQQTHDSTGIFFLVCMHAQNVLICANLWSEWPLLLATQLKPHHNTHKLKSSEAESQGKAFGPMSKQPTAPDEEDCTMWPPRLKDIIAFIKHWAASVVANWNTQHLIETCDEANKPRRSF